MNTLPKFKFLFLLALFLATNAFIIQQILNFKQLSNHTEQNQQLIDFITTSGDQQILPLVETNKLESIPNKLINLLEYGLLQNISLYKPNGELINSSEKKLEQPTDLIIKVSELGLDDKSFGYLIYSFKQTTTNNYSENMWIYYPAIALWLFASVLFLLNKVPQNKTSSPIIKEAPRLSYKKELQQLLKRSQSKHSAKQLLIINADWESFNNQPRQPLISLLNKWTAHHKCHLVSFEKDLMILGLPETLNIELLKKVQILALCLNRLSIEPTMLIHSLEFGEEIYKHFFGVVESGLWLESKEELNAEQTSITVQKDIEIEVESYGFLHLQLIDALKAEDATYIERQSRFFLQ